MNSKRIGNIGEAKVIAKFVEYGIPVYIPFGDNEKADLIADFNGKLNRIQVKTAVGTSCGRVQFDLTSSTMHRKNGIRCKYSNLEIDYFALYSLVRDKVYLLKAKSEPVSTISIRFEPTQNGQKDNIKYEQEYLFENVLKLRPYIAEQSSGSSQAP